MLINSKTPVDLEESCHRQGSDRSHLHTARGLLHRFIPKKSSTVELVLDAFPP
jgi:hypothetical protein